MSEVDREELAEQFDALDAAVKDKQDSEVDWDNSTDNELDVDLSAVREQRTIDYDADRDLVATQPHEISAKLLIADEEDELSPYYALRSCWEAYLEPWKQARDTDEEVRFPEDCCGDDWYVNAKKTPRWSRPDRGG